MKKLSELSDYELSILLNTTVAEARKQREIFREHPDKNNPFAIMDWTVDEFRQDYARGGFSRTRMIAGDVPRDVGLRFRQLQELLRRHFEFEARFPAAYEVLFPKQVRTRDRAGLYLPSFGIHILNSYPFNTVQTQDIAWAGDAYTFTDNRVKRHPWGTRVERRFRHPDYVDLQGILLAILSREEADERISYMVPLLYPELFDGAKPPQPAYVRLTDLRLAKQLRAGSLKRSLGPVLELLEQSIIADSVLEWKLRTLGSRLEKPKRIGREGWVQAAKDLGMEDEIYIGPPSLVMEIWLARAKTALTALAGVVVLCSRTPAAPFVETVRLEILKVPVVESSSRLGWEPSVPESTMRTSSIVAPPVSPVAPAMPPPVPCGSSPSPRTSLASSRATTSSLLSVSVGRFDASPVSSVSAPTTRFVASPIRRSFGPRLNPGVVARPLVDEHGLVRHRLRLGRAERVERIGGGPRVAGLGGVVK